MHLDVYSHWDTSRYAQGHLMASRCSFQHFQETIILASYSSASPMPIKVFSKLWDACSCRVFVDTETGGQLEISNGDHSTLFDWSSSKPTDIQWAAFVSGCEHKMYPMQGGNQIILVYNLRVTEKIGSVLQNPALGNSSCLPLYEGVRKLLEFPGFMKQGVFRTQSTKWLRVDPSQVATWASIADTPTITQLPT